MCGYASRETKTCCDLETELEETSSFSMDSTGDYGLKKIQKGPYKDRNDNSSRTEVCVLILHKSLDYDEKEESRGRPKKTMRGTNSKKNSLNVQKSPKCAKRCHFGRKVDHFQGKQEPQVK